MKRVGKDWQVMAPVGSLDNPRIDIVLTMDKQVLIKRYDDGEVRSTATLHND